MAIADGLERLPQLTARLESAISAGPEWLQQLLNPDPTLAELARTIRHKLVEAPPLSLSEGDLIHDGVDPLLMDCAISWTIRTPGSATRSSRSANAVASAP